jgi:hypothetical protein
LRYAAAPAAVAAGPHTLHIGATLTVSYTVGIFTGARG